MTSHRLDAHARRRKMFLVLSCSGADFQIFVCFSCLASLVCLLLQCELKGEANLCDGPVGSLIYDCMFTECMGSMYEL